MFKSSYSFLLFFTILAYLFLGDFDCSPVISRSLQFLSDFNTVVLDMTDSGNALFGGEAIPIFLILTVVVVGFSITTETIFKNEYSFETLWYGTVKDIN